MIENAADAQPAAAQKTEKDRFLQNKGLTLPMKMKGQSLCSAVLAAEFHWLSFMLVIVCTEETGSR